MAVLSYKYKLKGKRSARLLRRHSSSVNKVWNYCAEIQRKVARGRKLGEWRRWPSHYDLTHLTSGISKELGIHSQTIQIVCQQFAKSRDQHKRRPRFRKSTGANRSLGWVPFSRQGCQTSGDSITFLGHEFHFFGACKRPLPTTHHDGHFVEDASGQWWVTVHVTVDDLPKTGHHDVGIDLGIKSLATLSTGERIESPRAFRLWEERLGIAQRAHNKARVRAIYTKIANIRRDHAHKHTARIARSFDTIVVGDISSSQLAKTRMAKSVLDTSWSFFKNALRYKASRHGGAFMEIDERFTSQICSACGELPSSRPRGIAGLGVREWVCSSCGASHDRDVNAAKNILAIGLSAQPPAVESRAAHGRQPDRRGRLQYGHGANS